MYAVISPRVNESRLSKTCFSISFSLNQPFSVKGKLQNVFCCYSQWHLCTCSSTGWNKALVNFRKRKFSFPLLEIWVYVTFPLSRLRGNASLKLSYPQGLLFCVISKGRYVSTFCKFGGHTIIYRVSVIWKCGNV